MSKTTQTDLESFHEVQSVFFRNTAELTHKQVTEKFSKYGPIESIHQTGTAAGLCFVKFKSERSAERCAQALRNDSTITLRAFNPECPNRAYKLQPWYWEKRRNQEGINSGVEEPKKPEEPKSVNFFESIASKTIASNSVSYSSVLGAGKAEKKGDWCSVTSLESFEDISSEFLESVQPMSRQESIVRLSNVSKGIPEIVKKVKTISGEDNTEKSFYVLMRSQVEWEGLQGVDVEYVPAMAVVVGNIPVTCGLEELLEMFEDYQPLVSSKIKTCGGALRYCYVYFEDSWDCDAVQQVFDNVEVSGGNLVVMSAKFLRKLGS